MSPSPQGRDCCPVLPSLASLYGLWGWNSRLHVQQALSDWGFTYIASQWTGWPQVCSHVLSLSFTFRWALCLVSRWANFNGRRGTQEIAEREFKQRCVELQKPTDSPVNLKGSQHEWMWWQRRCVHFRRHFSWEDMTTPYTFLTYVWGPACVYRCMSLYG